MRAAARVASVAPFGALPTTLAGALSTAFSGALLCGLLWLPAPLSAQTSHAFSDVGYVRGSADAPVVVVEFVDMGCDQCRVFALETLAELWPEYGETGRVLWRVVPFAIGQPNGREGARAAECAADQDAFWSMHDVLFEEQREWFLKMRPQRQFYRYAERLGLDVDAFRECYRSKRTDGRTEANGRAAREAGVRATPTFLVNGTMVLGALPPDRFRALLRAAGGP